MDDFAILGTLAQKLHEEFTVTYYLCLPVFFGLALILAWFKSPQGSPEFIECSKRAFVATILLTGFQEITGSILLLTNGLSEKISDMSGIDSVLKMAGEKSQGYLDGGLLSIPLAFNDLLLASLTFLSYLFLYVARYLTLALYHFSWCFLVLISPVLLLFHLFSPKITLNLFRSLIEVASWNVVWSVLSAMLTALPFGNTYMVEGNYVVAIVLNVVIALAMLGTPLIVRSIIGSGISSVAGSLGPAAVTTLAMAPGKSVAIAQIGRNVFRDFHNADKRFVAQMEKAHRLHSLSKELAPPPVHKNQKASQVLT